MAGKYERVPAVLCRCTRVVLDSKTPETIDDCCGRQESNAEQYGDGGYHDSHLNDLVCNIVGNVAR
jgi:hypothetical protein